MDLKLTDEQAAALIRELSNIVQNDRYPLSPRIVTLKEILGLLRPEPKRAAAAAPPPPKIYAPPTKGRWRAHAAGDSRKVKPYRGPLMTLGNDAAARVQLVVWCKALLAPLRARPGRDGQTLRGRDDRAERRRPGHP